MIQAYNLQNIGRCKIRPPQYKCLFTAFFTTTKGLSHFTLTSFHKNKKI